MDSIYLYFKYAWCLHPSCSDKWTSKVVVAGDFLESHQDNKFSLIHQGKNATASGFSIFSIP